MNAQGAPPAKKVSVVVPVYNTEAFLVDCLDSLVNQTLDEIEIVVVNDGSPDGSQAIIDDYAARYPDKIVALSKPNGGLGSARNAGIARATGRYIGFVDSDDFVEPDMYQHLYEEAERTSKTTWRSAAIATTASTSPTRWWAATSPSRRVPSSPARASSSTRA